MSHVKPVRIWTQAEKNHLQHLLQERHDDGRYWMVSRTSRKFLAEKMNEAFPPMNQPDGRMFFVRHVEECLREWIGNHPGPRQVEMPESETDSEEEGGDEKDDDDDGDDDGGRGAVKEKAPEKQGEDGQDSQGAQDAGDQDEEGEDNDTGEEKGRRREQEIAKERAIADNMKTDQAPAVGGKGDWDENSVIRSMQIDAT
ncbi:hypothetical protein BHYA_0088g00200 [Botrytis hyacinthi]|uniref:Uncharacterized protein n=1 Tax=Botrytis hyacinthi TaxID=278943 RepID=A0A4Z1GLM4_9HELO|nr:hypothetical protein BHYA_0088g00200 [Botrytis hyacinthi]